MLNYDNFSEQQLLARCRQGHRRPFEELLGRDKDRIEGWILSFTKKPEIVQEIFQLTSIKAWKAIKKFRGDCKFSSWMCNIARNNYYDFYRAKQRNPEHSLDEILDKHREEGGSFEFKNSLTVNYTANEEDSRHYIGLIHQGLEKLEPYHREPLRLLVEEGLEYSEIAKILKCPVGTVMSRIFYARKKAQKVLKGLHDELLTH